VCSILFLVSLTLMNQRLTNPLLEEANKQSMANGNDTARNLRNAEVVESMGMLGSIRERWRERNFDVMGYQAEASNKGGALTAASKSSRQILQSCALGMGAYLTINGELTGGMMIAGSILLGRALAPIDQLVGNWKGFVAAKGQMERIDNLLETIPDDSERMDLPPPTGAITVEGITVVPPGGNLPVLNGVNFSLEAGESLAIIGPSAAGKSSLARVLLGVWPASNGFVRLDSADVFQWDREQLGTHIGYLPQDVELFDGTISENIARFGEVDSEKIVTAARLAGVHDMVLRLPEGYDTVIGASGGVLSGGQRQRIGLARAVYNEPRIVVLDEPNSNLDETGEAALREAVLQLRSLGTTVIIISHRTSVLTVMDKILVLRDGAMVEFGPAKEVVQKFQQAKAQLTAQNQAKVTASQTTPVQTVAIPNS
jgi:ATP-binding cassette subfamily C protein EexD